MNRSLLNLVFSKSSLRIKLCETHRVAGYDQLTALTCFLFLSFVCVLLWVRMRWKSKVNDVLNVRLRPVSKRVRRGSRGPAFRYSERSLSMFYFYIQFVLSGDY